MSELAARLGSSGPAGLERRYRRLLACYPRAYRRENGEEILAVLLACARDGQQRPGLAESADLIKSAVRSRLWPAGRPPRTVQIAVWLMCAGVAAKVAFLIITFATAGSVESAYARGKPPGAAAEVHHAWAAALVTGRVEDAIGIGVWLLLAWALVRGHSLARLACAAWFVGLDCFDMLQGLGGHAVVNAPADMAAFTVVWLLALASSVLLFTGASSRYYRCGLLGSDAEPGDYGDYGDYSALLAWLKELVSGGGRGSAHPNSA
jgi:hypothetical protein